MNKPTIIDGTLYTGDVKNVVLGPAPSARATSEPAGQPRSLDVATCSLPVSSAEALCRDWQSREDAQRALAEEKGERFSASGDMRHTYAADALKLCRLTLRREMVRAESRQPRENK